MRLRISAFSSSLFGHHNRETKVGVDCLNSSGRRGALDSRSGRKGWREVGIRSSDWKERERNSARKRLLELLRLSQDRRGFLRAREGKMGRSEMQRFAGFVVVLSLSALVFFNQQSAAFDWTATSSASASLSMDAGSNSYGMEGLHHSSMVVGEGMKRRRLQQTASAPAPSAAGSGQYIGYGVLTSGYVPCPPQSGYPYYTSNCQSSSAPVRPYSRGCSAITRCARG